ncbi:uncharacterized protein LOC121726677 [Aricia agestis]|uniref:uncharacterized protein LOC121726677 n=1 Tax=Aricia agestis TaxID=91739 RepID=UPI001C204172|nr:uncharacterized protein LOC121726677 [Aricia agestis]
MRRGHARSSGWRNENPRHFRPRNGGNPFYRPPRPIFGLLDTPRFPPPNHPNRPHAYGGRFENIERGREKHSGESSYRPDPHNSYQSNSEKPRYNERQKFFAKNRPEYEKPSDSYNNQRNFVQNKHDNSFLHKNSMGDVDHRQVSHNRNYRSGNIDPWNDDARPYRPRNYDPVQRNDFPESNKIPLPEYSGHRPPSSDHYGCSSSISTIEKSNSFSRSVDDTVDIVRKRLQNRSESTSFDNYENRQSIEDQTFGHDQVNTSDGSQESPIKRRLQRQRQSDKVNCAKMKNKIVNQLFKMDKEKIHKLMDNPNCSSKFEFAINSLITESQNSFNRHLRSVAEKSLCSSSDDFIQSDNNTIYEDTFMKQMQCILDPQDTILLEDIKPIVMAELSSILQVDEEDNQYIQDEHIMHFNEFQQSNSRNQNIPTDQMHCYDNYGNVQEDYDNNYCHKNLDNMVSSHSHETERWPLFQRRPQRISKHFSTDTTTSQYRNSNDKIDHSFESQKGFDANTEPLSEEDDTFAELDNQYHVAVDHDFIEQEDSISEQNAVNRTSYSVFVKSEKVEKEIECKQEVREEICDRSCTNPNRNDTVEEKPENLKFSFTSDVENAKVSEQKNRESNTSQSKRRTIDDFPSNKFTPDSRKRTNDQKPSHRKEKRKKSENSQTLETSKQILNKNIIINVNDCANKTSEKCDAPKSIFNLFFSKEKDKTVSKEINVISEKPVIKKEVSKTPDAKIDRRRKKCNSMSSNLSTSPKELNNSCNISSTSKTDTKATLKTIDMFTEKPKKVSIHQAHRNTSKLDLESDKKLDKTVLTKQVSKSQATIQIPKKISSKETQTIKPKKQTRFSQTINKAMAFKATQTDIKVCDKPGSKTTDPLERMKEIDLEIQALIQEKFKLYSSIESKESSTNSLNSLGMTVLNVGVEEEQNEPILTEDAIVENFVNIPDDELEKIVFNSDPHELSTENDGRKTNTRKVTSQTSQLSDVSARTIKKPNKKFKTPNISLIEQIITDERPLEDIISLDDYELTPVKKKGKSKKPRQISRKKPVHKGNLSIDYYKKYSLKGCSVVLTRTDIQEYLKDTTVTSSLGKDENLMCNVEPRATADDVPTKIIEEAVVNEIQFDMLDVSEDIVIGDVCAVKADNDKDAVENVSLSINEEVILDNSQSSMEEVATTVFGQNDGCKVFDYSADENLKRDSTLVSGNGDAILAIECVENNFLAASLDGHVYYFNSDGQLLSTLYGSNFAVTCLTIVKEKYGTTVYTGSLDSRLRLYDLETGRPVGAETNVLSPIQTMDRAWDTLFVGTRTGFVLQFEHKNNLLIPVSSVKFSDQSILALKAMKEGPRKVLLVAARSENVTIKDAQTGLLLRTLVGPKMTVYSLLYEDGKVYCGTSSHQIHVFDYTSGSHAGTHSGGKGAVCLRATGGLVFAGCYDGCVYIYREGENEPRAQIVGPSLMLLSLAVVGTKIIAGYKDRSLYIWKIPLCILQEMIL